MKKAVVRMPVVRVEHLPKNVRRNLMEVLDVGSAESYLIYYVVGDQVELDAVEDEELRKCYYAIDYWLCRNGVDNGERCVLDLINVDRN